MVFLLSDPPAVERGRVLGGRGLHFWPRMKGGMGGEKKCRAVFTRSDLPQGNDVGKKKEKSAALKRHGHMNAKSKCSR